ncbi:hypothetical protein [Mucilaginibacter sp. SP1R1]|uniref:hypothetical protein n=1 Tax=Mucilaginibacter sp. SP1R1 TaxID=2723091 RepID=UPI0016215AA5|nr:hypothetical protein [Mucilaginibacter sp. SP1R1]MBB6147469.1 uncharacterized protein (DUF3084 family) [Mucilaginibacter sp. SP1R1]
MQDLIIENKNLKETIFSLTQSNALLAETNSKLVLEKEQLRFHETEFSLIKAGIQNIKEDTGIIKDIVAFMKTIFTKAKIKNPSEKKKTSKDERVSNLQMKIINSKKLF